MPAFPAIGASLRVAVLVLAGIATCACSSIDNPFDKTPPPPDIPADAPAVIGAPKTKRISGRNGSGIAAFVNKTAITTNQVRRRAAFLKLRRVSGNRTVKARDELIEEALKMQEARRLRAVASDATVNEAYAGFAKRNRLTQAQLGQVLARSGVTSRGFKDYIRAQISWQRVVGMRGQAEASGAVAASANKGPSWLPAVGAKTSDVNQYTLQQVVFVVPKDKRSLINAKKSQANRFRSAWQGCTTSKAQAAKLKNVTILDRGRVLVTELPPQWRKDVEKTKSGGLTAPKVTEKGVEMLAVCKTAKVAVAAPAAAFDDKNLNSRMSALEKKYLAELRKVAKIEIR